MPTRSQCSQSQLSRLSPVVGAVLTRRTCQALLGAEGVRLYWRTLTPLVTVWGLIYQRLQGGGPGRSGGPGTAPLDAVVSALQQGEADGLDADDPHCTPLSVRLRSLSTSAYNQARQRLPLGLLCGLREQVRAQQLARLPASEQRWRGHLVRWLDGTTFRLPPEGDLAATYGRAAGRRGVSHWVIAKSVVSFCWASWLVVAHAEAEHTRSEVALVRAVVADEPAGTLYVADMGFGIYRLAQVLQHFQQQALVRLDPRYVPAMLGYPKGTRVTGLLRPNASCAFVWRHRRGIAAEPGLPCAPVAGRVLYARLQRPGFRAKDLYLFTTLTDAQAYPTADLVALYGSRWQVEVRYRELKTTLGMQYFAVRSAEMFRKELEAGLLTYTLIRVALLQSALQRAPDVSALALAQRLSFARARRRVALCWPVRRRAGGPRAMARQTRHWRARLGSCQLLAQPTKVAHEPRAGRRTPQTFPALKGSRQAARQANLLTLGAISS